MAHHRTVASIVLLAAAFLGGCAAPGYGPLPATSAYPPPVQSYPISPPAYAAYGTVESIRMLQQGGADNGIGAGAIVGGVVGGILGNQVGGGKGKKAATLAGVIGGAMIGHEVERNSHPHDAYQVGVRMDNGGYLTLTEDSVADLRVGSRVRIENDRMYRY
ncbi:glycine zipper 2TM domain-containing protein [Herbaspirillum sp. HC18]|nr:glycine zipper 2TM domain-containing protein [Herbaspirillum sp. HC18]